MSPRRSRRTARPGFAGPRSDADASPSTIERVQTGVRMEKRLLLVLKALAGSLDLSFGDLLEGIVLHAIEGKSPFGAETLARVTALRHAFGLDLVAADSHLLVESVSPRRRARRGRPR